MASAVPQPPAALEALRATLEKERQWAREALASTLRELRKLTEAHAEEDGYGTHPADVASDTVLQEELLGQVERLEEQLARVEEALRRMEEGTYGVCVDCGKPIPLPRLQVLPTALRDAACELAYEAQRKVRPPARRPLAAFPRPLLPAEAEEGEGTLQEE